MKAVAAGISPAAAGRWAWAVVAAGVGLRVAVWGQARSAYIDEVNLLRNFLERDYAGLFRPLGYEQYAPPLFSVLMKAVVQGLGPGERALRLVPLLAGCGLLVGFRRLALRWLPPLWAVLAVAFVAFGGVFVDYATVGKQYSTDALVAVGLLALAEGQLRRPALTGRAALGWAALGAGAVWASMPAVFVLAGVGGALAWTYRAEWRGRAGAGLAVMALSWGLSFLLYFKLLLQADAQSEYLQNFHREAFLAFPPRSIADWTLLGTQLRGLADKAFGKTALALALAAGGAAGGTARLLRPLTARSFLVLGPLLTALLASALHYYSLLSRLMLFALPLLLLLVLLGLSGVAARGRGVGLVVLAGVAFTLLNQQRLRHLVVPFQADYADVRTGLVYVAERQRPDEVVFSYSNLTPVVHYYQYLHPRPVPLRQVVDARPQPLLAERDALTSQVLALAAAGQRRLWLVYDRPDPWLREWAAQHGQVTQLLEFHRGYAFRVELP